MSYATRINPLLLKLLVIFLLTAILMVPLRQVESLIAERGALRDSAVERVAAGVGHAQYIGSVTATCYSLLNFLVLSERYALLFGALTLFAILASIMVSTRKFNWYGLGASRRDAE